ncbi:MAG: hypothetical protein WBB69_01805 [Anaerolineales bacterium]
MKPPICLVERKGGEGNMGNLSSAIITNSELFLLVIALKAS